MEISSETVHKMTSYEYVPPFWCVVPKVYNGGPELVYDWPRILAHVDQFRDWARVATNRKRNAFSHAHTFHENYEYTTRDTGSTIELWMRKREQS